MTGLEENNNLETAYENLLIDKLMGRIISKANLTNFTVNLCPFSEARCSNNRHDLNPCSDNTK